MKEHPYGTDPKARLAVGFAIYELFLAREALGCPCTLSQAEKWILGIVKEER